MSHIPARVRDRNEAYRVRLMAALAVSLTLALVVIRLPFASAPPRVGWQLIGSEQVLSLEDVRFTDGQSSLPGSVFDLATPVVTNARPSGPESGASTQYPGSDTEEGEPAQTPARVERLERLVLAAAEKMPEIQGGLGAYYINIQYPQAAIEAGIQGRLVLDFVVEPDGRATEVQVYKSLHPLCDSAAVRALRQTVFMPGRQAGQAVAVRMRLPVLFQIRNPAPADSTSESGRERP